MSLRRCLFWCHLCAGSLAGVVILIMSITGALLGFERQINTWFESRYRITMRAAGTNPVALDALRSSIDPESRPFPSVTVHAEPSMPLELSYGREKKVFLDPYNGQVLGNASDYLVPQ